jgi:hypothetical protein
VWGSLKNCGSFVQNTVYRVYRSPRSQKWGVGGRRNGWEKSRGGRGQYCTDIQRQDDKRQDEIHCQVGLGFIPIYFV